MPALALKRYRYPLSFLVLLAVVLALSVSIVTAFEFSGNYLSVKTLGRDTSVGIQVLRSTSGSFSTSEMGVGAAVSTGSPVLTDESGVIILNGTLSSLSGMPQATVYFEWGYDTSYGNTTAGATRTTTGAFAATISSYDQSRDLYFRAVADTDGTVFGSAVMLQRGRSAAWAILSVLLRIVLATVILIGVIKLSEGNPLLLLVSALFGIVAFVIISALIDAIMGMG